MGQTGWCCMLFLPKTLINGHKFRQTSSRRTALAGCYGESIFYHPGITRHRDSGVLEACRAIGDKDEILSPLDGLKTIARASMWISEAACLGAPRRKWRATGIQYSSSSRHCLSKVHCRKESTYLMYRFLAKSVSQRASTAARPESWSCAGYLVRTSQEAWWRVA
jgi:hypothetical protein